MNRIVYKDAYGKWTVKRSVKCVWSNITPYETYYTGPLIDYIAYLEDKVEKMKLEIDDNQNVVRRNNLG